MNFNKNIILIDASSFLFKHLFATITYFKLSRNLPDFKNYQDKEFNKILVANLFKKINIMQKKLNSNQLIFCYDGKLTSSWRYKIYSRYKQNRTKNNTFSNLFKILYDQLRKSNFIHFKIRNCEADDLLAVLSTQIDKVINFYNVKIKLYLISDDTDLLQLKLYLHKISLLNCKFEPIKINKKEAEKILNTKILKGDPSDNILSSKTNSIELNNILIDFRKIPIKISKLIIDNFNQLNCNTVAKRKIILKPKNWEKAIVINRPSKIIKSPYLADVRLKSKKLLVHTPALGMSGMISSKEIVYISKIKKPKKATHRVNLVEINNTLIGAEPLNANKITHFGIIQGWLGFKPDVIKPEFTFENSRIDFLVTEKNINHLIEVKSVILKENDMAYFPDGYVKKKGQPVSERALHHVENLVKWSKKKNNRSHLVFIVQRNDIKYFRLFVEKDPIFAKAVFNALKNINLHVFKVKWDSNKGCYGWKKIPIIWWLN